MTAPLIYLHGFASGPSSRKARFFQQRFASEGADLAIPDLAAGGFEHLTISSQLRVVEREAAGRPVSLIGSSMGGYLAALYASLHPEVARLVLLAPAFGFLRRWPDTLGAERFAAWQRTRVLPTYHYGEQRELALSYDLIEDGERYPDAPGFGQPALIFHGAGDVVVPPQASRDFAAAHPNVTLRMLDSDHELGNVFEILWPAVRDFLGQAAGALRPPLRNRSVII